MASFSGRPEATYVNGPASSALLQATIRFSFLTEVTDPNSFTGYGMLTAADQQLLALQGICSLADSIYLQFPYQQVIASPLNSETVGSYGFTKQATNGAGGSAYRLQAAAQELSMANTGIPMFDLAVQLLALRTIASGVFHGGMSVFDEGERRAAIGAALFYEDGTGRRWVLGPEDRNLIDFPFSISGESYPMDPGI